MRFFPLGLLILLFSSCLNEPDCIVTASSEVKISFQKLTSDSARAVEFASIAIPGTDSVFYVSDSVTAVVLPVNPGAGQTTFRFYYELKMDSMTVSYSRSTRVISPSCGAFNYFDHLEILSTSFSGATLTNSQLSISDTPNIIIKL